MRPSVPTFALALALALALPSPAAANGQSTHVAITLLALDRLPPGPVADLLRRPELRTMLVNGTMFPDWGYASGDRDHGEASHWEPFQQTFLRQIQAAHTAPYTDAVAAELVAFLFGMVSHGIADEHFDSLFMERSRLLDPGWQDPEAASLDTASDVLYMAEIGGIPNPDRWLPTDALAAAFALAMPDQPLDVAGMEWGHTLLHVAVDAVDALSQDAERVAAFTALYPWSTLHLGDPATPGAPPTEAEVVARTWLRLWDRLQATADFDPPVTMMTPAPDSYGHPLDASTPEARVHLSFAHGLRADSLNLVTVRDAGGANVPVEVGLFYGDLSHATLLRPTQDWEPNTDYLVTVAAGATDIDGLVSTTPLSMAFSTSPPPPVPPAPDPPVAGPCGGNASAASLLFALPLLGLRRERSVLRRA